MVQWLCIRKPADTTSEPLTGNGQTGAPVIALGHLEKMLSHRDGGSFSPMLPHKILEIHLVFLRFCGSP